MKPCRKAAAAWLLAGHRTAKVQTHLPSLGEAELAPALPRALSAALLAGPSPQYADLADLVRRCDVVTINCPLHEGTEHLFNRQLIG